MTPFPWGLCDLKANPVSLANGSEFLERYGLPHCLSAMRLLCCFMNPDGRVERLGCGGDSRPIVEIHASLLRCQT